MALGAGRISAAGRGVKYAPAVTEAVLPIFPLSNVVLFPESAVPLHIFEPRYRQMTRDALEGERRIGMVTVLPEHVDEMAGDPPVFEVGCAGFIADHRQLADGRHQFVLRATHRFRILRELPPDGERLYRLAETEPLPETVGTLERAESLRADVTQQLSALSELTSAEGSAALNLAQVEALELAAFANGVSQALSLQSREKQSLLEAMSLEQRLERLNSAFAFHLAAAGTGPGETLH
jgi:Lon protease-like protein